jgi:hypothetical protein
MHSDVMQAFCGTMLRVSYDRERAYVTRTSGSGSGGGGEGVGGTIVVVVVVDDVVVLT